MENWCSKPHHENYLKDDFPLQNSCNQVATDALAAGDMMFTMLVVGRPLCDNNAHV
jgi:hypothetical protein